MTNTVIGVMGAGLAKLLPYLDISSEVAEEKIKRNYARVLTAGAIPKKVDLLWKSINLSTTHINSGIESLILAAEFIHEGRVGQKNTIIFVQQEHSNAAAFAVTYFMILSGLSAKAANAAINNAIKGTDLKIKDTFSELLQALKERYSSIELRNRMFNNAGTLSESRLNEDVSRIYELCGLPKPTIEQIKLEVDPPSPALLQGTVSPKPTSPTGFFKSRRTSKEEVKEVAESTKSPTSEGKVQLLDSTNKEVELYMEGDQSAVSVMTVKEITLTGENESSAKLTHVDNDATNGHTHNRYSSSQVHNDGILGTTEDASGTDAKASSMLYSISSNEANLPQTTGRKIKIVLSKAAESLSSTKNVDEYLSHTSEEQRKERRMRVSIVRGETKA